MIPFALVMVGDWLRYKLDSPPGEHTVRVESIEDDIVHVTDRDKPWRRAKLHRSLFDNPREGVHLLGYAPREHVSACIELQLKQHGSRMYAEAAYLAMRARLTPRLPGESIADYGARHHVMTPRELGVDHDAWASALEAEASEHAPGGTEGPV